MKAIRWAWRIVVSCLALLGALVVAVSCTALVGWWAGRLAGPWNDPKGDVLVVLGGSMADTDILGPNSFLRAQYALLAWQQDHFKQIVITGGGEPGTPVACLMREFLVLHGVPASAIVVETKARSTLENARFLKPVLAGMPGTKVLLTSDYHMYRASHFFAREGIQILPRPFPDARKRASTWIGRWPAFLDVSLESAKIAYYRIKGLL